ncbi:DUF2141 domain-containing protein [Chitinolyticbacter meiyuanensis]|uniref:DUF2141 domain-containing protein n=1 Tax=Chitinolyticbacter meiyuanensis TaxID=682798 RepID=UPI0011E5B154|nr:DUF2141 domain-containing protein [Chitinolyticbacter meiyuanensis]
MSLRFIPIALLLSATAGAADLIVDIAPLERPQGAVRLALYQRAEHFLQLARAMQLRELPATTGKLSVRFADLPPGQYAVAAYLDSNQNGELDENWLGIPSEPTGFSRNPSTRMGPPDWADSMVAIGDTPVVLTLRLK